MKDLITEARELCDSEFNLGKLNATLMRKVHELCNALEKAEAELKIAYKLADDMAKGKPGAVQAYEDWVHAGEWVAEEGE